MKKGGETTIKRPLILYVIIAVYVLAPLGNFFLSRIFFNVPLSAFIPHLFKAYGILAGIWLMTAPIVGIRFYFVKKVSWYVFIGHSSLILLDYIIKWATRPLFYWQNISNLHNFLMLTGNLGLVCVVGYIIQKDFRAPYFQALPRSWRESERIPIIHIIILNGEPRKITDLSAGGCFVAELALGFNAGDRVSINFKIDVVTVDCKGEVRRCTPDGYGIQFLGLPAKTKRQITRMLKKRFSLRYEVDLTCTWTYNKKKSEGKILNISRGGCYIQSDVSGLEKGMSIDISAEINKRRYLLPARIAWINPAGEHEKPIGFGCQFVYKQLKLIRLLMKIYGKLTLTR